MVILVNGVEFKNQEEGEDDDDDDDEKRDLIKETRCYNKSLMDLCASVASEIQCYLTGHGNSVPKAVVLLVDYEEVDVDVLSCCCAVVLGRFSACRKFSLWLIRLF